MKELSIEQKAKAYDKALEKARKVYNNISPENSSVKKILEKAFPELKENEDENADEKVRKALIKLVTNHASIDLFIEYDIHLDEALSWLEKQGEHANFRSKIQVGDKVTRNEDGMLVNLSQLDRVAKKHNITGIGSKNAQGKLGEMIKNKKPADKVEPKFKVGDWILIDNPCQIESIDNNGNYVVQYCDTEETHILSRNFCDSHFRLWFQKMHEAGYEWDVEKKEPKKIKFNTDDIIEESYKQQADDLIDMVTEKAWSEDDELELDNIIDFLNSPSTAELCPTLRSNAITWLKSLKERITWEPQRMVSAEAKEVLYDKPATWSKEDKDYYDAIIAKLEVTQDDAALTDNQMEFLKSLKDKIQPKPKQEWSEDDENRFSNLIFLVKCSGENEATKKGFIDFINRLKFIRPKKSAAWSEEDEEMCQETIDWFEKKCFPYALESENPARESIKWLKSLKDRVQSQNQWKPSEEQMEALKCAVYDVAKFSQRGGRQVELENEPYYRALHSLYEQLKSL